MNDINNDDDQIIVISRLGEEEREANRERVFSRTFPGEYLVNAFDFTLLSSHLCTQRLALRHRPRDRSTGEGTRLMTGRHGGSNMDSLAGCSTARAVNSCEYCIFPPHRSMKHTKHAILTKTRADIEFGVTHLAAKLKSHSFGHKRGNYFTFVLSCSRSSIYCNRNPTNVHRGGLDIHMASSVDLNKDT